jgi:hypothetical protein
MGGSQWDLAELSRQMTAVETMEASGAGGDVSAETSSSVSDRVSRGIRRAPEETFRGTSIDAVGRTSAMERVDGRAVRRRSWRSSMAVSLACRSAC